MKKLFFLMGMLILAGALIMCSGEQKQEAAQETQQDVETTAVSDTTVAMCPGCGMEMARSEMVAYEEDGKTTYFCSEECKENYLASKETTAPSPPGENQ